MLPGNVILIYSLQFIVRSSTLLIKFLVTLHNLACFVVGKSSNSKQVVILNREYKGISHLYHRDGTQPVSLMRVDFFFLITLI